MIIAANTLYMASTTAKTSASITSSTSTAVFTELTDLSFSLISGAKYEFQYLLGFRVSVSHGLVVSLTFGAMSTFSAVAKAPFSSSDGTSSETQGQITASGGTALTDMSSSGLTSLTTYLAVIYGTMITSADGTIVPSFSTGRNGETDTVLANSVGILNRIS